MHSADGVVGDARKRQAEVEAERAAEAFERHPRCAYCARLYAHTHFTAPLADDGTPIRAEAAAE